MVCRCSVTQVGLTDNDSDYEDYKWNAKREEKGQNTFEKVLIAAAHEYMLLRGINIIMWLTLDLQVQSWCLETSQQREMAARFSS